MRKPDFEKVLKQDVEESPTWFSSILEPLNRLFEYVKEAFEANISIPNLKVQVIKYPFTAPFTQTSFQKTRTGKVVAVLLAQMQPQVGGSYSMDWEEVNNEIVILSIPSIGVGTKYTATFLAFYE